MLRSRAIVLAGLLALSVPMIANADDGDALDKLTRTKAGKISTSFVPAAADKNKAITVVLELKDEPVAVVQAEKGRVLTTSERTRIRGELKAKQDRLKPTIRSHRGRVVSQMQSAINGIKVTAPAGEVAALAKNPAVKAVRPVVRHTLSNATSVPYIGAPSVWQRNGYTGKGVKVAIIDTGIDYTHADFEGPGTVAAFDAETDTNTPNPDWFGPYAPRIKGGYDFVGDDYDASSDDNNVPVPDGNPIDCNGHGTHVAGTTGGGGVTEDGLPYTGPYNTSTHQSTFQVGPGVAPEVDLYALKVFGCGGSTDVVVEAIDWAVAKGMDVINMSLGSPYGTTGSADSIASENAVGAGVIVVAASGNEGHSPYMTGSPGTGGGVVSVAANESTATFPGAMLSFNGTTMAAVNANGIDPLPTDSFTIVNVKDDPATEEDESIGCSVAAYTQAFAKAGVTADGAKVIAVVHRGTCARVAKAIFGQQAGADAVIMINNADSYPPYEGPITENPDDAPPTPYEVTIPFLGVRSTDAAALEAAEKSQLTMSAQPLDNPAFGKLASFSSSGPRTGDSAIRPTVTAPGVSILSAGVGTGTAAANISGTSMATPHVAGVAALGVQAHPSWSAQDVSAALMATAKPSKVPEAPVVGQGTGLVDPAGTVTTQVIARGDRVSTVSGSVYQPTLSFGFRHLNSTYRATKTVTLVNRGSRAVTYKVGTAAGVDSVDASVSVSPRRVRVPARGTAKVKVRLTVKASKVPSSVNPDDPHNFFHAGGTVVFKGSSGPTLRVPYQLVPRATSNVAGRLALHQEAPTEAIDVRLSNRGGAREADADFYTLGLTDPRGDVVTDDSVGPGLDLRAAGVQTLGTSDGPLLVFAVNTWDRYSNAAGNEVDVTVDVNGDGEADAYVFATDSGAVRTGDANGINEVFISFADGSTYASGFLAVSPTDSSTVLLPVLAEDLGVTTAQSTIDYTVSVMSLLDNSFGDEMAESATYDVLNPAIVGGDYVTVPRNGSVTVPVAIDLQGIVDQLPKGIMVVVLDNAAGGSEALVLPESAHARMDRYLASRAGGNVKLPAATEKSRG